MDNSVIRALKEAWPYAAAVAVASGATAATIFSGLFNRATGATLITQNADNITRTNDTVAALQKIMADHPEMGSIVFANGIDSAHVVARNNGAVIDSHFALNYPAQSMLFDRAKKYLNDAPKMLDMARHPDRYIESLSEECARAAERAGKNWTQQRFAPIMELTNRKVQDNANLASSTLLKGAATLADAKSDDVNLSNLCHVQAMWEKDGIRHIVVMPTNYEEQGVIEGLMNGSISSEFGLTGKGIVNALATARQARFQPQPAPQAVETLAF